MWLYCQYHSRLWLSADQSKPKRRLPVFYLSDSICQVRTYMDQACATKLSSYMQVARKKPGSKFIAEFEFHLDTLYDLMFDGDDPSTCLR